MEMKNDPVPSVSAAFPGGNVLVLGADGVTVRLAPDLRDTEGRWFYWRFRAVFPAAGTWRFVFDGPSVGTRGPAVRRAGEGGWRWQSEGLHASDTEFVWVSEGPETVDFCQCIPYMPEDFRTFAATFADDPRVSVGELCRSRRGRSVPVLRLREGNPEETFLLTCRHHAQEAMASFAVEGLLRALASDAPRASAFRRAFEIVAVPFVDLDGVEAGDQGKNRRPHDHNRDYGAPDGAHVHPETAAIARFIETRRPAGVLDLHCPWLRGGETNEQPYLVGARPERSREPTARFGALLEKHCPPQAPFRADDFVPFGVLWNKGVPPGSGMGLKSWASGLDFVRLAQTIEIPFANFREKTQTPETIRAFGAGIAAALADFFLESR